MRAGNGIVRIATAAVLLALVGCHSRQNDIVGKWTVTSDSSELVWDFAPNGVVTSGDMRGRYSLGDQNRIKIQTPFATFVYQADLSGDRMTWKAPDGTKTALTRVK
jgi:hypothetical protein